MTIKTKASFTYGHTVTDENSSFNFIEGVGAEQTASIEVGSYTLDAYSDAVSVALNASGSLTYTTTLDRATRLITINSDGAFDLLITSGTLATASSYSLIGFSGADLTGLLTYTGDLPSGEIFIPQFYLQKFVDFADIVKTTQANINTTPSGLVEVVSYGTVNFMECNITLQTNIAQGKGSIIDTDAQGYENLRSFLTYCITKAPIEFIPDKDNPDLNYTDCLLEKSQGSSKGVDFKIKELYSKGYAEYYESSLLTFRKLI
ncbi:MAG: hypothetical protein ACI9IA_000226 [Enterobacterales bacterium]|jgi:hypothetical protein